MLSGRSRQPLRTSFSALFDDVRQRFELARVPVLLLKGRYFADRALRRSPCRARSSTSTCSSRAAGTATQAAALLAAGFERAAYDLHSQPSPGAAEGGPPPLSALGAGLPHQRSGDLDDRAADPSRRLEARTLSDDYTLVLLGLGAFEDLGQGMTSSNSSSTST